MAFQGTHIRFALDVQEEFGAQNLDQYLSGCIYPDSRYVTKLNRKSTHDVAYLKASFWENSDFKKGLVTHLLCDKAQRALISKDFSDILNRFPGDTEERGMIGGALFPRLNFYRTLTILNILISSAMSLICAMLKIQIMKT